MPDESQPDPAIPFPPDGGRARPRAAAGRRLAVRAEVGRLPRRARERRRRARLWSRNARPLLRYFPELRPLGELLPPRSALDGEIVIVREGALDFDAMQMRLHPAESRIRRLSAEIPAEFVAFDVLLWDGEPVWERPLEERRARARARRRRASGSRRARATSTTRAAGSTASRRSASTASSPRSLGAAVPARLARGRGQGQGAQDGRLRRHRRPLEEGLAGGDRDAAARPLPRRRRGRLRRHVRGRGRRGATRWRSACCRCSSATTTERFTEPNRWGTGDLEQSWVRQGARRRGALRQGAGQPLPPRHEVAALARRQGSARLHLARAAPAARPERARASSRSSPSRARAARSRRRGRRRRRSRRARRTALPSWPRASSTTNATRIAADHDDAGERGRREVELPEALVAAVAAEAADRLAAAAEQDERAERRP